ncbi:hypothetical protein SAY86_012481 [Trapa natans]|uniref:RST domain-containing protein n=1 Tax=Trapa natans TaxID=22666 RepID=A0AAN7LXQ9_TRANT|nr:hypothetical protein SAY86_012481 [Trapa natans]
MDPSIMKLLEEDEDESMHSGADVDAFQAALNRDIGGDASTSQPPASGSSQVHNHITGQSFIGWQSTVTDGTTNPQAQRDQANVQNQERLLSEMGMKYHGSDSQQNDVAPEVNNHLLHQKQSRNDNQPGSSEQTQIPKLTGMHISEKTSTPISVPMAQTINSEPQYLKLQKVNNQQAVVHEQPNNRPSRPKQVPFALLLPVILPQLDKDRGMQLHTLYVKLKKNEISKEGFVRIMRGIVGDQMLKLAVTKLQQSESHQFKMQGESSSVQNHPRIQSAATPVQESQQQQLQHVQSAQSSFPVYASGGSYHSLGSTNVSSSVSSVKSQPHDFQIKQMPSQSGVPKLERPSPSTDPKRMQSSSLPVFSGNAALQQGSSNWKSSINKDKVSAPLPSSPDVKHEPADHYDDQQNQSHTRGLQELPTVSTGQAEQKFPPMGTPKDSAVGPLSPGIGLLNAASSGPSLTESPVISLEDPHAQTGSRLTSPGGNNSRTPAKKPSVGQKKPLESLGSSPPSSKKQKVSGAFADQSIEQLIDVTAVSGVNLREEEEQLFSGPKEDSRASEASRKVVQEEEDALILQRAPLQKKMAEIMDKCGVKIIASNVKRCLSLCLEERMQGLLCSLIRVSKQRVDMEKLSHRTVITSDVCHQLTLLNRRAREEWEMKQAEAEKLRKLSEPDGNSAADSDKEKDEGRGKAVKVNKEEDDKMRTTAANVAARAAVGGDDMFSKWQMMAEQARQKRVGGSEGASSSQPSKSLGHKPISASGDNVKELQETGKQGQSDPSVSSGVTRKFGRNQDILAPHRVARTISIKDVITVLEREPQMSKSTLIYRLYDQVHSDTVAE